MLECPVELFYGHLERISGMRRCSQLTRAQLRRLDFLPTKPPWLKLAIYDALTNGPMAAKREKRMIRALGLRKRKYIPYHRPCLPKELGERIKQYNIDVEAVIEKAIEERKQANEAASGSQL